RSRGDRAGHGVTPRTGAVGDGVQGHSHRLPRTSHSGTAPVRQGGPVRVALPHRRARGNRDDAALPHGPGPARPAGAPRSWSLTLAGIVRSVPAAATLRCAV